MRPRGEDAVGQIVREGVRGVGAFPGLRDRERTQTQQPRERHDLGADVHDDRPEVGGMPGEEGEARTMPGMVVRCPVQGAADGRIGGTRVEHRAVVVLDRVGVVGEDRPFDAVVESRGARQRRERTHRLAQVRLHGEEAGDVPVPVVVDVPADHHDTAGT